MKKLFLIGACSILASCASNSINCWKNIDRSMLIPDMLETHAYDYCCPKGYSIEFVLEVLTDGKKEASNCLKVIGRSNDSSSAPISANRGMVVSMLPLDWIGEEYTGKLRISLSIDGKKPKSVIIQNPRGVPLNAKTLKGGGSLIGQVEFPIDKNPSAIEPKILLNWIVNKYEVRVTAKPVKVPLSNY